MVEPEPELDLCTGSGLDQKGLWNRFPSLSKVKNLCKIYPPPPLSVEGNIILESCIMDDITASVAEPVGFWTAACFFRRLRLRPQLR